MRRQLNTLYATTDGAWLHRDGENIVMRVEQEERARMPVHMLESVVCIGRVGVSPQLLGPVRGERHYGLLSDAAWKISGAGRGTGFGKCFAAAGAITGVPTMRQSARRLCAMC